MPTRDQVAFHNEQELRKRAAEQQLAQQASAQQAQQHYQIQSQLAAEQHAYGQAQQQQQFGQQQHMAMLNTDLQTNLNRMKLSDEEQMRIRKLERARASVEDNPDLAPSERQMLYTQIESGLNPLEARAQVAQTLHTHLQSQALSQQTDQQAVLFNQRQERLAAGAQGRQQVFTDPVTGQRQLFQMDLEGNWQALDFGLANERHLANMQHLQAQTEATQQGTTQSAEMQPGRVQQQGLQNQQLAETVRQAREIHPLDVDRARLANQFMAQQIEQNPQAFNLQQLTGYAHLGNLQQQLSERLQTQQSNVQLHAANAAIAGMNAQAHPENQDLQQQAQRATIAHTQAATEHTNALVGNMPSVQDAQRLHGAQTEHAVTTAAIAGEQLQRLTRGGLPDHIAAQVVDHAIGGVDRDLRAADAAAVNTALTPTQRQAAQQRARELRGQRGTSIRERAAEAEALVRRTLGLPPTARQPAPQGDGGQPGGGQPAPRQAPPLNEAIDRVRPMAEGLPAPLRGGFNNALNRITAIMAGRRFEQLNAAEQGQVAELWQMVNGMVTEMPNMRR